MTIDMDLIFRIFIVVFAIVAAGAAIICLIGLIRLMVSAAGKTEDKPKAAVKEAPLFAKRAATEDAAVRPTVGQRGLAVAGRLPGIIKRRRRIRVASPTPSVRGGLWGFRRNRER